MFKKLIVLFALFAVVFALSSESESEVSGSDNDNDLSDQDTHGTVQCAATGDPHYHTNVLGRSVWFNYYGRQGHNFVLFRRAGILVSHSIQYGRLWANRGLTTGVRVIYRGRVCSMNDHGIESPRGCMRASGNPRSRVQFNNNFGGVVVRGFYHYLAGAQHGGRFARGYYNLYVDIPRSLIPGSTGLCINRQLFQSHVQTVRNLRHEANVLISKMNASLRKWVLAHCHAHRHDNHRFYNCVYDSYHGLRQVAASTQHDRQRIAALHTHYQGVIRRHQTNYNNLLRQYRALQATSNNYYRHFIHYRNLYHSHLAALRQCNANRAHLNRVIASLRHQVNVWRRHAHTATHWRSRYNAMYNTYRRTLAQLHAANRTRQHYYNYYLRYYRAYNSILAQYRRYHALYTNLSRTYAATRTREVQYRNLYHRYLHLYRTSSNSARVYSQRMNTYYRQYRHYLTLYQRSGASIRHYNSLYVKYLNLYKSYYQKYINARVYYYAYRNASAHFYALARRYKV